MQNVISVVKWQHSVIPGHLNVNVLLLFSGAGNAGTGPRLLLLQQHRIWSELRSLPAPAAATPTKRPVSASQCWRSLLPKPPKSGRGSHWTVSAGRLPVPALLGVPCWSHHQQPPGPGQPELRWAWRHLCLSTLPRRGLGRHSYGRWVRLVPRQGGWATVFSFVARCLKNQQSQEQPWNGRGLVMSSVWWSKTVCRDKNVRKCSLSLNNVSLFIGL